MKTKKIPYYVLVGSLTLGASLILGFLSFTGAMALWPLLPVAGIFFALSVAYEAEIYLKNIKGALDKLGFKENFMRRKLARQYLAEFLPDSPGEDDPIFFRDYSNLLALQAQYKKASVFKGQDRKRKKAVDKAIKKMEKWFALLLFEQKEPKGEVETELVNWLRSNQQSDWVEKAKRRQFHYQLSAVFSGIAGLSMAFGTTYLLLGALASMPAILVASPLLLAISITAASLVAGTAYALLTFNTVTDMIDNNTVQKWIKKLKHNLFEKPTVRSVLVGAMALVLFTLALALTICTAGTWWTVIKQTPPLFRWMAKIPRALLSVFPFINGAAALSFNFQNTSESFKMVDGLFSNKPSKPLIQRLSDAWRHLTETEAFWQRLNPFRLILKLTFTPLRILFFSGHLISIALTSDRLPKVPQIMSFLVGLVCEGFEDAHYFLSFEGGHAHHHGESCEAHKHHGESRRDGIKAHLKPEEGHSHDNDLPTRLLRFIFTPLFYAAAFWDYKFSDSDKANWQNSRSKFFGLSQDGMTDESAKEVKIDPSLYPSLEGMGALKKHLALPLEVKGVRQGNFRFFEYLEPPKAEREENLLYFARPQPAVF